MEDAHAAWVGFVNRLHMTDARRNGARMAPVHDELQSLHVLREAMELFELGRFDEFAEVISRAMAAELAKNERPQV